MKKTIASLFILPSLLITPHFLNAQEEAPETPTICTLEYAPVCGEIDTGIRCITTPCPSTEIKTFGNECQLNAEKATYLYEGECQETDPVQEPNLEEPLDETSQEIKDLLDQIEEVEDAIDTLNQEIETPETPDQSSWIARTWNKLTDWIIFWK